MSKKLTLIFLFCSISTTFASTYTANLPIYTATLSTSQKAENRATQALIQLIRQLNAQEKRKNEQATYNQSTKITATKTHDPDYVPAIFSCRRRTTTQSSSQRIPQRRSCPHCKKDFNRTALFRHIRDSCPNHPLEQFTTSRRGKHGRTITHKIRHTFCDVCNQAYNLKAIDLHKSSYCQKDQN